MGGYFKFAGNAVENAEQVIKIMGGVSIGAGILTGLSTMSNDSNGGVGAVAKGVAVGGLTYAGVGIGGGYLLGKTFGESAGLAALNLKYAKQAAKGIL